MKLFLTMKKGLGDLCAALWYNWLFLILKRQYKRTINIDKQVVVPCKRRIKEPIGRLINLCLSQKQFFHRLSKITQPCALRSRESCKYVNLRRCVRVTSWGGGVSSIHLAFHNLGSMNVIERQGRKVNSQTNWLTITSPGMASLDCSWMTGFQPFPRKTNNNCTIGVYIINFSDIDVYAGW